MTDKEIVYEGEAWLRLKMMEREGAHTFVLEVRPDVSKGLARWGRVRAKDRPRRKKP